MGVYAGQKNYGDIYQMPTSAIDDIANRIYREHQLREQRQQQEVKALDGMFGQNMSKMRDIDIPTFTQKVGDWKQSAINLLKRPPKNQQEYIKQQLEVQRKLAEAQTHGARSAREKEDEENAVKGIAKDPYGFKETANPFIAARRATPIEYFKQTIIGADGKPMEIDMTDINGNIIDDGRGTDFTKVWGKAQGNSIARGTPIDEVSPDKLTTTTTTFKGFNPPSQMLTTLSDAITGERATNHFIKQHPYTDQQAEQILSNYEKLKNSPEFKSVYPNEPEFPATMFLSPLGRAKALSVMERALANPPLVVKGTPKQNVGAVIDYKDKKSMANWRTKFEAANGEWNRRRPLKFADSLALIEARNNVGVNTDDYDAGYITDDYFKKYGKQIDMTKSGWVVNGIMKGEEPAGFVPVSSIHPSDINLINGFDKEKKQLAVNPIEVNGVKGYIVKKDGDWVGDNGLIPRERVRARNIETRMNTKFKKNEQNTQKGFNTPKGKTETKSTGKWEKYKVN